MEKKQFSISAAVRFFGKKTSGPAPGEVPDEAWRFSFRRRTAALFGCFAGGMLYAAALPPLNLEFLAFVALLPVMRYALREGRTARGAAFGGWLWGLGWSLFAYRFLREIEAPVPYLLAPVISLWPAAWAAALPALYRGILFPNEVLAGGFEARERYVRECLPLWRTALFATAAAALFTLVEWTRSRLFVWNDFSVTQWRNIPLIQLASLTGSYGVGFMVAWCGAALHVARWRRGRRFAAAVFGILAAIMVWGWIRSAGIDSADALARRDRNSPALWRPLLIQGDLSQRRHATAAQAAEAVDVYVGVSLQALRENPGASAVIWPESAIPLPFYSDRRLAAAGPLTEFGRLCRRYQEGVFAVAREAGVPLVIGALDFEETLPLKGMTPRPTNSALCFTPEGKLFARYDKMHRVPYGEYVPFREFLPEKLIRAIDMGRDLAPGRSPEPLRLPEGVRAGTAICYEGIFGYLSREFARRGANVLLVLSNDAWYPRSSEPEQHLANAVMRAVETGLVMVRCGNNGGSGAVLPNGRFTRALPTPGWQARPELRRGKAYGIVEVAVPPEPSVTVYVRFGEWFIALLALFEAAVLWKLVAGWYARKRHLSELLRPEPPPRPEDSEKGQRESQRNRER